ncbi:hypothetical protein EDD16DRAFT_1527647 [Pisolithus croceorrhizus]|nr:hypothetical protein EDD16DRAFT_1527647 [Pisolithus croceorrhizus]
MQAQASALLEWSSAGQYDCICIKYSFGHIHKVSHTAWLQHLANAGSEEECQRICTARLLGEQMTSLPPLANPSSLPTCNYFVPPSMHRIEALWGLAKWARENCNLNEYVGCCKCARVQQPIHINQTQGNSGIQVDVNKTAGHVLSPPVHLDDGGMDNHDTQFTST